MTRKHQTPFSGSQTRGGPHGVALFTTLLFLVLFLLGSPLTTRASASLIAASKIQYCRRDGSVDATEPVGCSRKMIVTLTIDSDQLEGVEDVVFINSAADETDSSGSATTLQFEPLRLSTRRSPVIYRYPVFYTHNFNTKPFEENIGGTLFKQCNADFNAKTATCGISTDVNNQPVPYSQGFCCDCGICATLGLCKADWRASKACDLFKTYTTASCLRFAELWYSGYTIGPMRTSYDITLTFSTNTTGLTNTDETHAVAAVLHLSPQTPEDSATSPGVLARLIGDFASSEQPWDLTTRMLFIPAMPRSHPRVAAGVAEYMLLPSAYVSMDGRACNKVGVSYEAFASQGNACHLAKGSCLAAQLEDYRTADVQAVSAGRAPQYFVSAYGNFSIERLANASTSVVSPYLSYKATVAGTSMVTVTLNADDLHFVVSVSPGRLLDVKMNLDTISASTKDGVLVVRIQNTGTVSSRYVVSVPTCSDDIFPITAQTVYLAAQEIRELTFSVLVQDVYMNTNSACCNVTLRNQDALLDSSSVTFKVNSTNFDNGPQGGGGTGDGGTYVNGTGKDTCSECNFIDVKCTLRNICINLIVGQLALILGILAVLFIVVKFRRCFCCCFSSCIHGCGGGDHKRRHRHRRPSLSSTSSSATDTGERRRARHLAKSTKQPSRLRTRSAPPASASRSRALVRTDPKAKSFTGYSREPFAAAVPCVKVPTYSNMSAAPYFGTYAHEPFEEIEYVYDAPQAGYYYHDDDDGAPMPTASAAVRGACVSSFGFDPCAQAGSTTHVRAYQLPTRTDDRAARYAEEAEMPGLYACTPDTQHHPHSTHPHATMPQEMTSDSDPYGCVLTSGYPRPTTRAASGAGRRRTGGGDSSRYVREPFDESPPPLRKLSLDGVEEAYQSSRSNW